MLSLNNSPDELTSTVIHAMRALPTSRKADFLLDTSLDLIEAGDYGPEVENFLEVYLKTPNLPPRDVVRALTARGKARKARGQMLLAKADQDFQAALKIDPSDREVQQHMWRDRLIRFKDEPASQRCPPEIWERIASHIPRYHLRTWLFVSSFHRAIAVRIIFHTLDLYFGEDPEGLSKGLDIFDRVKADPKFAHNVKSLRLHWAYEEGDTLDLMARIFRNTLPEFKALRDFEWIGYPEMRADMVQAVLASHSHLQGLGLIGWHFDAVGVSAFRNLHKFTLRAEDDDGFADMGEVRTVLDRNAHTLRHLILGAYLARYHSWDSAFESVTIKNLTHLDLVDTRISHVVLSRIAHAGALESLTLHGTFEEPGNAAVVFGTDHIIDGKHTFLPHLEAFRFVLVGHDDEVGLYKAVTKFLRQRTRLRRLDLGNCPWDMVQGLLPELPGLRVLGVRIANLSEEAVSSLVKMIPAQMVALNLSTQVSDKPLNEYTSLIAERSFTSLSFLHLHCTSKRRPKPNLMSEKDFQLQTDAWMGAVRSVATALKTLDFIGWHGEHYVVVRSSSSSNSGEGPKFAGSSSNTAGVGGFNDGNIGSSLLMAPGRSWAPWNVAHTSSGSSSSSNNGGGGGESSGVSAPHMYSQSPPPPPHYQQHYAAPYPYGVYQTVEVKELPSRRRLDCGKGVDLGGEDAAWLERKDVPMDYEMPGLE